MTHGGPTANRAIKRLCRALVNAGAENIAVPVCVKCQRDILWAKRLPEGYACQTCAREHDATSCTICGRTAPIGRRIGDDAICRSCNDRDPSRWRKCAACGSQGLITSKKGGVDLCSACYERPKRPCDVCGNIDIIVSKRGGVSRCRACYEAPPAVCGLCGEERQTGKIIDGTAICKKCYKTPLHDCESCGRRARTRRCDSQRVCYLCKPRDPQNCFVCHSDAIIAANWPLGRVCRKCYKDILNAAAPCHKCGCVAVLIGRDEQGHPICGPCAGGAHPAARCATCGAVEELYERSTCARCVLHKRLTAGLADPIPTHVLHLIRAIEETDHPWDTIIWLRTRSAKLLLEMARAGDPFSHDAFDRLGPSQPADHARELLIRFGLLPPYDRYLHRLELWTDRLFNESELCPEPLAQDITALRRFATWVVQHSIRDRAHWRETTKFSIAHARRMINEPLKLLLHLYSEERSLRDLTQADLDVWISEGSSNRLAVRFFLNWSAHEGTIPGLSVSVPRQDLPSSVPWSEDKRWAQVRRLLHDDTIDLALRVAGLLLLVYGQALTRIARIRRSDIIERDGNVFLRQRKKELRLGPGINALVRDLLHSENKEKRIRRHSKSEWLFPSPLAAGHVQASQFTERLCDLGIVVYGARTAALIQLAGEIPSKILSEMLDIDITTAVQWRALAKPDQAQYVAHRASHRGTALERSTARTR